MDGNADLAEMM